MERAALIYSKAHICVFYMSMIEYKSYILVVGGFVSCQHSVGGAALHYSPFLTNRPVQTNLFLSIFNFPLFHTVLSLLNQSSYLPIPNCLCQPIQYLPLLPTYTIHILTYHYLPIIKYLPLPTKAYLPPLEPSQLRQPSFQPPQYRRTSFN